MGRTRITGYFASSALLWLTCFSFGYEAYSQTFLPATPAGEAMKAFISAFNSADRSKLEMYVRRYDSTATADELLAFSGSTGGFSLLSVERSTQDDVRVIFKGRSDGIESFADLRLASVTPPRVKRLIIRALPTTATIEDVDLTAATRGETVGLIESELTDIYVDPAVAVQMVNKLQEQVQAGAYAKITDGNEFADTLTRDLRAVSHDGHLFVAYSPSTSPEGNVAAVPGPAEIARYRSNQVRNNCSFSEVRILPRNVGYLKFDEFADATRCGATAVAALGFLAHVDALIVDLRDNHGGQPAMLQLILSYFFSEPTQLNDIYFRPNDDTHQYWTLPYVPGPRLVETPIYVLTSRRTFSGAEAFANDLKIQKRATIVGETTGGGSHPLIAKAVGNHFVIGVPIGRPVNAVTLGDWEGTGVTPDIEVPADDACKVAQKLAETRILATPK
jgi:hypothetical protein